MRGKRIGDVDGSFLPVPLDVLRLSIEFSILLYNNSFFLKRKKKIRSFENFSIESQKKRLSEPFLSLYLEINS